MDEQSNQEEIASSARNASDSDADGKKPSTSLPPEKTVSPTDPDFIIFLIFALIIDGIDIALEALGLVFDFVGGIGEILQPISWAIDGIAFVILGWWMYSKGKSIGENRKQRQQALQKKAATQKGKLEAKAAQAGAKSPTRRIMLRLGICFLGEIIPVLIGFLPFWTISVIMMLDIKKEILFPLIGTIIIAIAFLLTGIPSFLAPTIAEGAEGGHSVAYNEELDNIDTVSCINNYIEKNYPSSPYKGMGADFVAAGKQYGIHPGLVVAIGIHESGLCTNDAAAGCQCYNAWGRTAGPGQPTCEGRRWYAYNSISQSIASQTQFIKENYLDKGYTTVEKMIYRYAPPSENDTEGYIETLIGLVPEITCGKGLKINQGQMSKIPLIKQYDEPWGSMPYGDCGDRPTYATSGCGPTSLTMVINYFTGKNLTPPNIGSQILNNHWRTCGEGTDWDAMTGIPPKYNLTSQDIGKNWSAVESCFNNGGIVIASMSNCQFTSGGHFIVLTGVSNDNVLINDPGPRNIVSAPVRDINNCSNNFWCINNP